MSIMGDHQIQENINIKNKYCYNKLNIGSNENKRIALREIFGKRLI